MALQATRWGSDPRLEQCLNNTLTMRAPEEHPAVKKIQQALIDLGYPLPQFGDDGKFGTETGDQVAQFKLDNGIEPHDPVVGPKTMARLDQLCLDKPPAPFSDRDEWRSWLDRLLPAFNFTRQDMLALSTALGSLTFHADSSWLPDEYRNAIRFSLTALLDPTGSPDGPGTPPGTWGLSPLDFYHGHVCLPQSLPDAAICAGNGLTVSNTADRARVKADASATPSNQQWSQNFASFYRAEKDPFGRSITQGARDVLDETLTVAATHSTTAVIVWHTYEFARWRPAGMTSGDPRRHWVVPVPRGGASLTHPPTAPFNDQNFRIDFAHVLQIEFVVDKAGVVTVLPDSNAAAVFRGLVIDDVDAARF
jgi:Putative peptidoglycan binding domain